MASEQTPNLGLNKWAPSDYLRRAEFNQNFNIIDNEINNIHSEKENLDTTISNLSQTVANNHESVTTQLAEKASQTDLNTTNNNVFLKANESDVDSALNLKRDKAIKIELEEMSETALAAINGNATFNLLSVPQDGSVSVEKTNFITRGKNKFDGNFLNGTILTNGTYNITDADDMVAIIPITGGKTYYFRRNAGDRKRVGFHKTKPDFTATAKVIDYYIGDVNDGAAATAPLDALYMLVFVSTTQISINMQITENEDLPFFIGYDVNLQIQSKSQPLTILDSGDKVASLLKNRQVLLYGNSPLLKVNYVNKTIIVGSGSRVFYEGKRTVISNPETPFTWNSTSLIALYFNPVDNSVGIHVIGGANTLTEDYILIGIINPIYQEIYGIDIQNCEINGEMFVHQQTINKIDKKIAGVDVKSTKYFFLDDINGIYEKPSDLVSVASGQLLNLVASPYTIIYAIYDDLVTRFPNVTRTLLGNEATGLPIYQYKFSTPTVTGNYKNPKILLTSAVHGYEQGSAWCLAQFFKDLCDNYSTKEQLEFMRFNVDFLVVPVVNPYGFNHNQRTNSNLVDINRNFNAHWTLGTADGDPNGYYGGATAASELETQIMQNFIDANIDAEYLIDYHNIAGGYPLFYIFSGELDAHAIANNVFKTMTRRWKTDYSAAPQDDTMFGTTAVAPQRTLNDYAYMKGIKTFTFETPWKMPFAVAKYDKITIETGVEAFGNVLVTIFKSLK